MMQPNTVQVRSVARTVAILNLLYFSVEFSVASKTGSVALYADSIDFLEDAAVNFLILAALGWSPIHRARVGMLLAGILLIPAMATLGTAWQKFHHFNAPSPYALTATGFGALLINVSCAVMLARIRHHSGSLTKAAFLSSRNDAFANIAIIIAGFITWNVRSAWPDLVVGLGIALLNADAAREVYCAARDEGRNAS